MSFRCSFFKEMYLSEKKKKYSMSLANRSLVKKCNFLFTTDTRISQRFLQHYFKSD